ncbi:hypothetical protein [Terribacillus saccharophilus]|uniref:hypothetical protein n=1 Tax=Terribacillus saccharophilus TaxID=361277 RepID=UPI003D27AE0A
MKKVVTVLVALVLTVLVFNPPVSAEEGINLTEEDYSKISQQMKVDGSSQEDIDKVIAKLKNGETLDADKPNNQSSTYFTLSSSSESVYDEEKDSLTAVTGEEKEKTTRFDDGSYIKVEIIEEPSLNEGQFSVMAASKKTVTAKGSSLWGNASYKADVYIDTRSGGSNYIGKVWGYNIQTYLGTYSDANLDITRKTEHRSKGITAKSRLRYTWNSSTSLSSKTTYLKLHTGDKLKDRYGIWVDFTSGSASYK